MACYKDSEWNCVVSCFSILWFCRDFRNGGGGWIFFLPANLDLLLAPSHLPRPKAPANQSASWQHPSRRRARCFQTNKQRKQAQKREEKSAKAFRFRTWIPFGGWTFGRFVQPEVGNKFCTGRAVLGVQEEKHRSQWIGRRSKSRVKPDPWLPNAQAMHGHQHHWWVTSACFCWGRMDAPPHLLSVTSDGWPFFLFECLDGRG